MNIRSKKHMLKLFYENKLGNRLQVWHTKEDLLKSVDDGFDGLIGIRYIGKPGLPYYHHKTPEGAIEIIDNINTTKYPVLFFEASQDQYIIFQGEITEYPWGYGLEYTTKRTHMRVAFKQERKSIFSNRIPSIIQANFNKQSLDDLLLLFKEYPYSTIEFSCYEILVGIFSGRNVCHWEVRHY